MILRGKGIIALVRANSNLFDILPLDQSNLLSVILRFAKEWVSGEPWRSICAVPY